ncbi:class II D-tagatose-bisphosphate aldolase non-catalytic subunit [Halalkalibacter alkaliphilus]|uniref:Class II D-tagatose-bisphosphate aldolase, non-catalytic subunit n=1 Tax=Halalkalibacter alkaliphilus TaxID=2917993 RepID=A0A9X1ZYR8_9BACI|nr:class II D-tagatose-bisphosphate aldolase, non-catalytic subunit [Halalkalibacter alkaliphilus]MCL7745540.1 class II D-tagatose-bisphosphate aldolase, non-catalytic subunit [Halalkalibacter alkaliphilus]
MQKVNINELVKGMLSLQDQGEYVTALGIGPMSSSLLQASFELAKEKDFPLMFIASRNQVDSMELGGGYVCNWDQASFVGAIADTSKKVGFEGLYYVCRDHGGPWQRDNERNAHLEESLAMELGKQSYIEDMKQGFDLLHIDPTKDPFEMGKVIPMETVLRRTIELIEFCENERKKLGLPEIGYEVGTEETNGGLTSTETYETFIKNLNKELEARQLPTPTFIVGQTGTLVKKTENVGTFNGKSAKQLADIAKKYGVGLKEHNGDYIDDHILLQHLPLGITATNVAPLFGTEETRAYLELIKVEKQLVEVGLLKAPSNLEQVLKIQAIKSERWRKWMVGDQSKLGVEEVLDDQELTEQILDIAGHYTFNEEEVKQEIEQLFNNLKECSIDGERFVVNRIKRSINQYVECFNLEGSTTRILEQVEYTLL